MLAVENLQKSYLLSRKNVDVLTGVDLQLGSRECVVIRGSSGCGKTTLLLAVGAMLRPDHGSVSLGGQDIYALSAPERARLRAAQLGFVFQTFQLIPYLTVLENVLVAAEETAAPARARELLSRLGLEHRLDHRPSALSAGEQQRTAIARAMINRPQLILADEPTGNLDDANAAEVFTALRDFRDEGGSVLLVTHGEQSGQFADRVLRLENGKLAEST